MAVGSPNYLQNAFLGHVRKQKIPLAIFLANGIKLQGILTWFDNFTVQLTRNGESQLIYKNVISAIVPSLPIKLHDDSKEGD
jgi:host factor-I protein